MPDEHKLRLHDLSIALDLLRIAEALVGRNGFNSTSISDAADKISMLFNDIRNK